MFIKFSENGIKIIGDKRYVYEVKALILNEDDGKNDIVIEPFNEATLKKIQSLLNLYLRTSKFEPTERDLPVFAFQVKDSKILVSGEQGALKRAINTLSCNAFISMETSRQVLTKLKATNIPNLQPISENTPLLARIPVK